MTLGSNLPCVGLIYRIINPAGCCRDGSPGRRPLRVDGMATRGQCGPRNVPRPRAAGRETPLTPHPSLCGLLAGQPHLHLLHLPGAWCTPSSSHISPRSDRSDTMILQTELPRLPGLGPDPPPGCAPPAVMMRSPCQDSGPEWT